MGTPNTLLMPVGTRGYRDCTIVHTLVGPHVDVVGIHPERPDSLVGDVAVFIQVVVDGVWAGGQIGLLQVSDIVVGVNLICRRSDGVGNAQDPAFGVANILAIVVILDPADTAVEVVVELYLARETVPIPAQYTLPEGAVGGTRQEGLESYLID